MLSATEWATLTAAQVPVKRGKYKLLVVCRTAPSILLQQLLDISKTKKGRTRSIKSLIVQYNPRTKKAWVLKRYRGASRSVRPSTLETHGTLR